MCVFVCVLYVQTCTYVRMYMSVHAHTSVCVGSQTPVQVQNRQAIVQR